MYGKIISDAKKNPNKLQNNLKIIHICSVTINVYFLFIDTNVDIENSEEIFLKNKK